MENTVLIIHVVLAFLIIILVLLQKSEGGGLGIGGSRPSGGFMTASGTANFMTKLTAFLGGCFFFTSSREINLESVIDRNLIDHYHHKYLRI